MLWTAVHQPTLFSEVQINASLKEQRFETKFSDGKVILLSDSGVTIKAPGSTAGTNTSKADVLTAFSAGDPNRGWSETEAAYFSSYALWNYLTAPFLFTYDGFEVEEVRPWQEEGEEWRVLRVLFPPSLSTHSREQFAYFGPDGLLRRLRYTVPVLNDAGGVNYALDYDAVQGLRLPTTRRVFGYDDRLNKMDTPLLVSIEFTDIALF